MAWIDAVSTWTLPAMIALIPLIGYLRGVQVYEAFIAGAEEGVRVSVQILPYVVGILVALGIFRSSGAMDLLGAWLSPLTARLGFPNAVLPLLVIRPLSGSGALAAVVELMRSHGPDSFVGRLAAVMQGSTDTTFYVISVYFGSVGVRRALYAPAVGICGDLVGFVVALLVCKWFFPA